MLRPTRLLAFAAIALLAFLYWKPTRTYLHAKGELQQRQAEVRVLREQKARLHRRLAAGQTGDALVREARRLGLVKPGERLFIVKGIPQWRAKH